MERRKVLHAYPTNTSNHLYDTVEFILECHHRIRKRIWIDQNSPDALRCYKCRDGVPAEVTQAELLRLSWE